MGIFQSVARQLNISACFQAAKKKNCQLSFCSTFSFIGYILTWLQGILAFVHAERQLHRQSGNFWIILSVSPSNISYGYSLDEPGRNASSKYPQVNVSTEKQHKYLLISARLGLAMPYRLQAMILFHFIFTGGSDEL